MEFENEKKSSTSFLDSLEFIEKGVSRPTPTTAPFIEPISKSSEIDANTPSETSNLNVKSSQRMKYDAEVKMIQNRWGDLESIRRKLGLSQRKMAQLLMVDPSAWTRWVREAGEAPPHIYRSLSWFMTLQEKHPENSLYQWLAGVSQPSMPEKEISSLKNRLSLELKGSLEESLYANLESKLNFWRYIMIGQGALVLLLLAALTYKIVT